MMARHAQDEALRLRGWHERYTVSASRCFSETLPVLQRPTLVGN
jgi:hypothetical protein